MNYERGHTVRLISHEPDDYLPPIGTIGTIGEPADEDGDCYVIFLGWPCPAPPGSGWYVHWSQLAPEALRPGPQITTEVKA